MSKLKGKIGENVKKIRIRNGMSQRQLAAAMYTKQCNISLLETGKLNPTIDYLEKIANALEVEVDDLVNNTNEVLKNK